MNARHVVVTFVASWIPILSVSAIRCARTIDAPETGAPVAVGSDWLCRHQSPDGSWRADCFDMQCEAGDGSCTGKGTSKNAVGPTGLALLAALCYGQTHVSGRDQKSVKSGLEFLIRVQQKDGHFGSTGVPDGLHHHALASLALVEAYRFTQAKELRDPAQRALEFATRARAKGGAWLAADGSLDLETTAWMALVMRTAKLACLTIEDAALADAAEAVAQFCDDASGRVATARGGAPLTDNAATAAALLVRLVASRGDRDAAYVFAAAAILASHPPGHEADGSSDDPIGWNFASIALFQIGGKQWEGWNAALREAVIERMNNDPRCCAYGSWDPSGRDAARLGRLETTSLEKLTIAAYYRYPKHLGQFDH